MFWGVLSGSSAAGRPASVPCRPDSGPYPGRRP